MTTSSTSTTTMLPYRRQGEIDYASLDFNPDKLDVPPDHMEQEREIHEIYGLILAHFTDYGARSDIFASYDTNVCYDPDDLNVRLAPDVYVAFGVDAEAIRPRKIYLPWEVGKPPDWALEVASESTARNDDLRKPDIYARIGVQEYWRFDPTGGQYYDAPLTGLQLVNGIYQAIDRTTEPDGVLKGYSAVLGVSLCWDQGWPRLYNPATGGYLETARQVRAAREAAEAGRRSAEAGQQAERAGREAERFARQSAEAGREAAETARQFAEAGREAERAARQSAEAETERIREQLRRLQSQS